MLVLYRVKYINLQKIAHDRSNISYGANKPKNDQFLIHQNDFVRTSISPETPLLSELILQCIIKQNVPETPNLNSSYSFCSENEPALKSALNN